MAESHEPFTSDKEDFFSFFLYQICKHIDSKEHTSLGLVQKTPSSWPPPASCFAQKPVTICSEEYQTFKRPASTTHHANELCYSVFDHLYQQTS